MSQIEHKKLNNRNWIISGVIVILIIFVGGGAWASLTKIAGAVIAPGVFGVESKIKTVEHLEGGIVEEIFVRNGDVVEAGDPLVRLDDTHFRANLNIVSNNLLELLAREARLKAELQDAESISFPDEVLSGQDRSDEDHAHARQIIADKVSLFEARRDARSGQKQIMAQQIIHLEAQISGLEAQMGAVSEQSQILEGNIQRKEEAAQSGVIAQDAMELLQRQLLQVQGETGGLQSSIARIRSTITQTELQILQIDIDLRENVQAEMREVSNRIAELREQKISYENNMRRTLILAPVSGLVHNLTTYTLGGVVAPASPIMQIIPANDRLIIEARISTTDIDQISIGQEASVLLVAFDSRTTPRLNATVTNISAAQLIDPTTNAPYFTLEVEIPKSELLRLSDDQVLLPGMPAETYITTGERSPLDYFLKPLMIQITRAFKED